MLDAWRTYENNFDLNPGLYKRCLKTVFFSDYFLYFIKFILTTKYIFTFIIILRAIFIS